MYYLWPKMLNRTDYSLKTWLKIKGMRVNEPAWKDKSEWQPAAIKSSPISPSLDKV